MIPQKVQVRFGPGEKYYSYAWTGTMPLAVGDRVVVPPNWASPEYQFATVVALDSNYEGELAKITGMVDKETQHVYWPDGEPG